jgi:hypothetical protein
MSLLLSLLLLRKYKVQDNADERSETDAGEGE